MRFKQATLLVSLALAVGACTLKLNEQEAPKATISVNPVQEGCLSNVGPVF